MDRIIEKKRWTVKRITLIAAIVFFASFIALLAFQDRSSRLNVIRDRLLFQKSWQINSRNSSRSTGWFNQDDYLHRCGAGRDRGEEILEDGANVKAGDTILRLSNANMQLSYMDQETRMYDAINNLLNSRIALEQNNFSPERDH